MSYRVCTLCGQPYEAGTYRQHADEHVPIRRGRQGSSKAWDRDALRSLVSKSSISAVAREFGLSRQRVHALVHEDTLGRKYRADVVNAARRKRS